MMERNPWFTLTAERLPIPCKDEEEMSYLEYKRAIFAYIFGSFGFEKDLAKAELYCCHGISELNKKSPLIRLRRMKNGWAGCTITAS